MKLSPHLNFRKLDLAMKTQLTVLKLFFPSLLALSLVVTGCKSGFDVEVLPLDPNQVINYGTQITGKEAAIEAVVFGQLMPGSSEERSKMVLNNELKDISQCIIRLKALPKDFSFDSAQEANFNTWIDGFQTKLSTIAPSIHQARTSPLAAQNLAATVETEVKTGGTLETRISDGEKYVPDTAKGEFDRMAKDCVRGYERVYMTALVLPQSLSQKDCIESLNKVESALQTLSSNANSRRVFTTIAHLNGAIAAVTEASNRAKNVRVYVEGMTQKFKVANSLDTEVTHLQNALTNVTNNYVNVADVAMQPEAKTLTDDAITAAAALKKLSTDYLTGIENLKDPKADAKLDVLATQAFTGSISVILGDFTLDRETDINELTRLLGSSPIVVMKEDASSRLMVQALASSVVNRVAASYGLPDVDNVVGPDQNLITTAKQQFSMSDSDFNNYAKSRARKIREVESKDGNYKNVYVLFADSLMTQGADIRSMVDEFASDKGRVLLITSDTGKYEKLGKAFGTKNLDILAGILAGNAVLQQMQIPGPVQEVSERVVRLAIGLKGSFKLADVSPLMKDAALRIQSRRNAGGADLDNLVVEALAAHGVPTTLVGSSGILLDSLPVVRGNLSRDINYYVSRGSGRGAANLEADLLREQGIRNAAANAATSEREIRRRELANRQRDELVQKADRTRRALSNAANGLDVQGKARLAADAYRIRHNEIKDHFTAVRKILDDRACSAVNIPSKRKLRLNAGNPWPIQPANVYANDQEFFRQASSFEYPTNLVKKDRMEQLRPYVTSLLAGFEHGQELSQSLANTNDFDTSALPYVSLNCYAIGNVPVQVRNKLRDLEVMFDSVKNSLRSVRDTPEGATRMDIASNVRELRKTEMDFGAALRSSVGISAVGISDFSGFDPFNDRNFWHGFGGGGVPGVLNAPPYSFGRRNVFAIVQTHGGLAGQSDLEKVNRRLYAYLFAMVVGKLQNASIPMSGNLELYQGFVDNDVFAAKITNELAPHELTERYARRFLLKELAELTNVYGDIIKKVYDLPLDDREAFENNPTANQFLDFYNKIKTIVDDQTYLANLQDFTRMQRDLRDEIIAKVLPDEVMTMLNSYPSWHPHAYFTAAAAQVFLRRWLALPPLTDVQFRLDFDAAFPGGGQFAIPGGGDTFIKDQAAREYESLRALADLPVNGGPHAGAPAARIALGGIGYPPALPAALEGVRFQTGTAGVGHLAAESDGVKKLIPIWNDLLSLTRRVYESADKIYFYLTLIKKS